MPFVRPDLPLLINRIGTDLASRVAPGGGAPLRRSLLGTLAAVEAGAVHGLYGFLDWVSRQVFPDSAEREQLERWALIWGVVRKEASPAKGEVVFLGAEGALCPLGTLLMRQDRVEYRTIAEGVISGGVATVAITSVGVGDAQNSPGGSILTLASPVIGVQSRASVASGGLAGGADEEGDESLRTRLLERIHQPPHGGAAFDYRAWAMACPGVTRVWVAPREMGAGTVTIRILMDDSRPDGIPTRLDLDAILEAVELVRPVTAEVYVLAPIPAPLDLEITGLSPASNSVRAAVEGEIRDLLLREAVPGGTILVSHLREAISIASGEWDHRLASPTVDVAHATGEIAVLGEIRWT